MSTDLAQRALDKTHYRRLRSVDSVEIGW